MRAQQVIPEFPIVLFPLTELPSPHLLLPLAKHPSLPFFIQSCPHSGLTEYLATLRRKEGEDEQEPRISRFFSNEKLIDLSSLVRQLQQNQRPQFQQIGQLPPQAQLSLMYQISNVHAGVVPHAEKLLFWFPNLLGQINEMTRLLMEDQTNIHIDYKYFIAVITAANQGCNYLYCRLANSFLKHGGQKNWLVQGLQHSPPKFRNVSKLANLLGHSPWCSDIGFIIDQLSQDWSTIQVIEIVVIISNYLGFSSYCLAMGLQVDCETDISWRVYFDLKDASPEDIESRKRLIEILADENLVELESKDQSSLKSMMCQFGQEMKESIIWKTLMNSYGRFIEATKICDRSKIIVTKSEDFNFRTHSYAVISQFSPELGERVSKVLWEIKHMTNWKMGQKSANTSLFRNAIRYYFQRSVGYINKGFSMAEEEKLLNISLKFFIKILGTRPYLLCNGFMSNINFPVQLIEFTHVVLLVSQARFQHSLNMVCKVLYDRLFDKKI